MQGSQRGGQVHQARISTWKKASTLVMYEWMGVWAGLDAGSNLLKITDYLARFPSCYPSREPSLPSCTGEGGWLGFSPGLSVQGPGWCTRVWSAEWEEVAAGPCWQMAKWLGNVRALPVLDQHDSRGSVVPANTRQSSSPGRGMSHVRVWASPCRRESPVEDTVMFQEPAPEWAWIVLKAGIIPSFYRSLLHLALCSVYCRSRAYL